MKKNRLFLLAATAFALLLGACSTELSTTDNPLHAGAGEAILSVSIQFPQADKPAGYAPGDVGDEVLPGVALDAEKEIKSIAFVAFTQGGSSVYLSTNPTLSDNGFLESLKLVDEVVAGKYKAQFKIKSGDFGGTTTIVAIANYWEHGLDLEKDWTLVDLKKALSDALVKEEAVTDTDKNFIKYPLLMSGSFAREIVEGALTNASFVMERIMARVDVVNKAYDKTTPADGFVLTSARLLSAAAQGTLMGGQAAIPNLAYLDLALQTSIAEKGSVDPTLPVDPTTNPALQQLAPMYVYENSNTDANDGTKLSATATWVEVTGTYKGKAYKKKIEFRTLEKVEGDVKKGGEIVPIARNTRYVVEISSGTENEPVIDVKVTDWLEGKDLEVEIDFDAPVFEGLDNPTVGAGAAWEVVDNPDGSKTRTLNITNATAGTELEFLVRGYQDTDFTVETEYDENEIKVINGITVDPGVLSGYADGGSDAPKEEAPLARTYKVKIPQAVGECPSLTKIIVFNAAYADARTEINVKYAPFFMTDWRKDNAIIIDPATRLIDLKNVANGQAGTVSFFASANAALENTTIVNKGLTTNFYTIATVDEADIATLKKYGPGKRVTLSYKALTNVPEWAEVSVKETGADAATAKKLFVKSLKKTYFESVKLSPVAANTLVEGANKLYLAVNNGDHGTIEYTVYDDASNTIVLEPSATYAVALTNPDWVKGVSISGNTLVDTYADYQIVKRTVKVALPTAIKNPSAVTNFKVGANTSAAALLQLSPVYLAGTTITAADKAFAPVLVKGYWWAPINIGQTKISTLNNPSTEAGNLFQWGRKQALTWASPTTVGPLAPNAPEVTQDKFITVVATPYDWRNPHGNLLWNSDTDAAPTKVEANDPCPAGWRVPTQAEWTNSIVGGGTPAHEWQAATSPGPAQNGLLTVSGEGNAKLYFPAAGRRNYDGSVSDQGTSGYYWVSAGSGTGASNVYFNGAAVSASNDYRAPGMSVRCVQEFR